MSSRIIKMRYHVDIQVKMTISFLIPQCLYFTPSWWSCCWPYSFCGQPQLTVNPTSWCTSPYVPSWEASRCQAAKGSGLLQKKSLWTGPPTAELWLSSWAWWGRWLSASSYNSTSSTRPWRVSAPTTLKPDTMWRSLLPSFLPLQFFSGSGLR